MTQLIYYCSFCLDVTGEIKSVYVRNLPSTVSESEMEVEFKKLGKIRVDGVVICGRKVSFLDIVVFLVFPF